MALSQQIQTSQKLCFVTIGATAAFDSLIKATLSPPFLEALQSSGYTDLLLQHGKEREAPMKELIMMDRIAIKTRYGLTVSGFDFNKQGLTDEMKAAKGLNSGTEGVVISHAGSGSVLAALRIAVPIIVVPNPDLLDNHQVELAEALAAQDYVVHGRLE